MDTAKLKRMHEDVEDKLNLIGFSLLTSRDVSFFKLSSATLFYELCVGKTLAIIETRSIDQVRSRRPVPFLAIQDVVCRVVNLPDR
jgi:hypothetical protein